MLAHQNLDRQRSSHRLELPMNEQSLALRGGSGIAPSWREHEHVMSIGITSA
jgi:hypothetical protein